MTTHFNFAQTFFVDPSLVQNAYQINLTQVVLYFKAKPNIIGNKSGIYGPGVEVRIAPTVQGVPFLVAMSYPARAEYGQIAASSTAGTPTTFTFDTPIGLLAGQEYAVLIKFDGDEDYALWENKRGDILIDELGVPTNLASTGASGQYIGRLYSYISPTYETPIPSEFADLSSPNIIPSTSTQAQLEQVQASFDYLLSAWNPLNDEDLKFSVSIARYSHSGFPVQANDVILANDFVSLSYSNNIQVLSNNAIRLTSPSYPIEFVYFDKKISQTEDLHYGDMVYEYQPFYPGGRANSAAATVSVSVNNNIITTPSNYVLANGVTFTWPLLYSFAPEETEYIVVVSRNHYGANAHAVNVRRVFRSGSNTQFVVSEDFTFSNTAANFFKSPVGRLYSKSRPYVSGHTSDLIQLADSNANATCRFVNNYISSAILGAIGAGYSNNDILRVTGFESVTDEVLGGYQAVANIVTFANGSLSAIHFSNVGCGFQTTPSYSISNNSLGTSNGSGATLTFTIDAVLYTQFGQGNTFFANSKIVNFEAQALLPVIGISNPPGTVYNLKYKSLYRSIASANTVSGKLYYIDVTESAIELDVKNYKITHFNSEKHPLIVSRSNQFVIGYANGYIPNTDIIGDRTSNTALFIVDMFSNSDFAAISMNPNELNSFYAKYNISDDYTDENTNYGNAYAKHIATKVNFANGQFAEDLLVFLTAYKPQGTDIQVLARLHNSHDSEPFDDKDWTILELQDGIGVYSSLTNQQDMVELTYGLRLYPNTGIAANTSLTPTTGTLAGVVNTALNSETLTGVGTAFNVDLATGDLIKLYQPLFANTDYMVAVVNAVTSSTIITINSPITNNSLVASGMKIDKISYPLQAFKNLTNDNVARYYSQSLVEYDTFDTMQIKIVLLSPDDYIVPKIDDIRAVGVTA